MNTRRSLFTRVVLSLLVAAVAGVVGGGSPALAIVDIASRTTTTIPYSGMAAGPSENVFLSGLVEVKAVVVRDPDFGRPPTVVLSIDFSNVTGQGQRTKNTYVTSGNQVLLRPLVSPDVVDVIFTFFPSGSAGLMSARPALASFTFNYDTVSGKPTTATAAPTADPAPATEPAPAM